MSLQIFVTIHIVPAAAHTVVEFGIKVLSSFGSAETGGDYDETAIWDDSCTIDQNGDGLPDNTPPNCDSNEQILELRLRAPDLEIVSVHVDQNTAKVGEMLSVNVQIRNIGNIHATDVNVVLCVDQSKRSIQKNGCNEENVAYRQLIEAVQPVGSSGVEDTPCLLYTADAADEQP